MDKTRWRSASLVIACALAALLGPASTRDAHGAYLDCRLCHLDPSSGSPARSYSSYFTDSPRHHSTGKAYPSAQDRGFFRPTALAADIAFFDSNGNGVVDVDEVQLFGAEARIECSSCHREHGEGSPPTQPGMYLRKGAGVLCLVCHRT